MKKEKRGKIGHTLAVVSFALNTFVIPGLGSLIGGRTNVGIWQLVLLIIGVATVIFFVGFAFILAAWIWALVTSVSIAKEADRM